MRHLFQGRDFCSSLEGYCMNQAVAGSEIPAGGPLCSLSALTRLCLHLQIQNTIHLSKSNVPYVVEDANTIRYKSNSW